MPDRLASGVGFNPQKYALKDSGSLTNASVSGSFVGSLDGSISGSSVLTDSVISAHKLLSGSQVHGLGTLSTQDSNSVSITGGSVSGVSGSSNDLAGSFTGDFAGNLQGSISGSAVLTQNALTAHIGLSGSQVHGLGTMSIQNADNVNITGGVFSGSISTSNFPVTGQVLSYNSGTYRWVDNGSGAVQIQGDWNASTNTPDLITGSALIPSGYTWRVSVAGSTVLGSAGPWEVNDLATKTATDWIKIKSSSTTIFWGNISGSLSDQTDLQNALNQKENSSNKSSASSLGLSDTLYPTQKAVKNYADAHIGLTGTSVHGLGTISTQNSNSVNITGGTITETAYSGSFTGTLQGSISGSSVVTGSLLSAHLALSGSQAHGLGTMSTQSATSASIGGYMSGSFVGLIDLSSRGMKDSYVSNPVVLGDASNTSLDTDNKTMLGAINEVYGALSYLSAGVSGSPATLLDNNNGTATISSVEVLIYDNPNFVNAIRHFSVSGSTFAFTDGAEEYVAIRYNSGSPVMYKETVQDNINNSDVLPLFTCWRQGNTIHSLGFDSLGNGLSNKAQQAMYDTELYKISVDGGLIISETTTPSPRTVLVTGGTVYTGAISQAVNTFNSSVDTMTRAYHSGGSWVYTNTLVYDNLYYDNGTDLVALAGKWGTVWFYRSIGDVRQLFYVLGSTAHNKKSDAELENPRTDLNVLLRKHCILVGRAIIQGGATSGDTQSAFGIMFTGTSVINHNDTNNIQGGDSLLGQYYHVTSAQSVNVSNLSTMAYQSASAVIITGGSLSGVTGVFEGSISGSSVLTNNALVSHQNGTGSAVHGLGTISTQNANNVLITGGSVTANLTGHASLDVLKSGDTMSGSLVISASGLYALDVSQTGSGSILRLGNAVDNTVFENTGFMAMSGSGIVWNDIPPMPLINARNGGGNQPVLTALQGNVQALTFNIGDFVFGSFEVLHEYKEGTDIDMHIHWATQSSDATARGVRWEVEYTVANLNDSSAPPFTNTFPASVVVTKEVQIPANTPVKVHIYTDIGNIPGSSLRIGSYICWRLRRVAALVTPTAPASNPYGIAFGAHYQQNTLGSRTEHSK